MKRRWSAVPLLALSVAVAWWIAVSAQRSGGSAPAPTGQPPLAHITASDAKVLAEFKAKVDAYDALRKDLAKKTPPLKKTDDPAEITRAEKALAQQIKAARASAKPGDIFTPATQRVFKRLLNPTLKGDEGAENTIVLKEDRPPASKIPFEVNGDYPKDQPLSTVPPDLLRALPQLPEAVQYRFAGRHLLLYCTRGNLIVDYMLNAIP